LIAGVTMKILLVSGGMHRLVSAYATPKVDIVNRDGLGLLDAHRFLHDVNPVIDGVLITDEAFSQQDGQDRSNLSLLLDWLAASHRPDLRVILLTRDFMKETELESLCSRFGNASFIACDDLRIPETLYKKAFEQFARKKSSYVQADIPNEEKAESDDSRKKKSFFDRFRSKPKNDEELSATDLLTREIEKISRGISRVIAVTGHRGNGLTSTVVNLASEASKRGLNVFIIDMDIDYRSTNMYFSRFHEQTKKDEDMSASLIRTLARPQDYKTAAFNIKDNLWLTSLGYDFNNPRLIEQFYNNAKFVGLLSMLRSKFNLIILDMPMDLLRTFKESMIHIDVFGLCVPNNLHSILSTLRNVEVVLDREGASYLNAKSKVIVTKYNDRSRFQGNLFTPDKVGEVLTSGLSERFIYDMKLSGHVPHSDDFDSQIERDIPLVQTSTEFESAFGNILIRLMEGVQ
jgi:septum formation inhibitor-activating ATPase MinD